MNVVNVNPKDVIFSLDIGTRTVIGTVGVMRDKKFSACLMGRQITAFDFSLQSTSTDF